jgi:hypothetical protein
MKAFSYWSAVSALTFSRREESPNLNILFAPRDHHDSYPFDGRGGVLAHAFVPEDGRVHFDSDEYYTDNTPEGTNLLNVAVHEIGYFHLLFCCLTTH